MWKLQSKIAHIVKSKHNLQFTTNMFLNVKIPDVMYNLFFVHLPAILNIFTL